MNSDTTTYGPNDLHKLNRALEHLWEAQQAVNAERDKITHYKLTSRLAKLADRITRARADLCDITDGLSEELE